MATSALYWDVEDARIAGLAIREGGSEADLHSWWSNHFGR
jgi:hypothetical protein